MSSSFAIGTEVIDNVVSDRMVVRRIGAVGTVRLVFASVNLLYPFHLMIALAVFRARGRLETHFYEEVGVNKSGFESKSYATYLSCFAIELLLE